MGLLDLLNLPQLSVPGVATPTPKQQPAPVAPLVPPSPLPVIPTMFSPNAVKLPTPVPQINPVVKPASDSSFQMLLGMLRYHAQPKGKGGSRRGTGPAGPGAPSGTGGPAEPGIHGTLVYPRSASALPKTIPNLRTFDGATLQAPAIASLIQLRKQTGANIFGAIGSSYRDYAQQVAVYNHNTPLGLPAASPGSSYHEQGLAMDLNSGWVNANPKAMAWLTAHGWHSGASFNDPYHWTLGVIG